MSPYVRAAITGALVIGGVFAVAILAPAIDRRGLPGVVFALAVLTILVAVSLRAVLGELPPRGRRRLLADFAKERGWRMRIRPRLPRSLLALPSFSDPRRPGTDLWNMIAVPGEPVVLTFDRRIHSEDAYESPIWVSSAACRIDADLPELIVEPRPAVTADPLGPLIVRTSELEEFGHRFRIRTQDPLFSTALLDQRMLAWMLEQPAGWTYEVGGSWVMVSTTKLTDGRSLADAVERLRSFRVRIPPVAETMRTRSPA